MKYPKNKDTFIINIMKVIVGCIAPNIVLNIAIINVTLYYFFNIFLKNYYFHCRV